MIDFEVPAMSCGHCVQAITRTVQRVDPAAEVQVDLPTHRVRIGSTLDPGSFRAALTDEGYAPKA